MAILPEDRHEEMVHTFGLWAATKSESEGNEHLVRLWELCEPEIRRALQDIAAKQTFAFVEVWLKYLGLSFEEVSCAVFPAVKDAAYKYESEHDSGASF